MEKLSEKELLEIAFEGLQSKSRELNDTYAEARANLKKEYEAAQTKIKEQLQAMQVQYQQYLPKQAEVDPNLQPGETKFTSTEELKKHLAAKAATKAKETK